MSGSLIELLRDHGHEDIVAGLRRLHESGKVEFTGSAMYHPILPLIPSDEGRRQIVLNQRTMRNVFGDSYHPSGFFPPELCFAPHVARTIVETGHRWVLMSGVACQGEWPLESVPWIDSEEGALSIIFRDDVISNRISFANVTPEEFLESIGRLAGDRSQAYIVTAMDAETFGHHIRGWETVFLDRAFRLTAEPILRDAEGKRGSFTISAATVSEVVERFPRGQRVVPQASSWSTTGDDLAAGNPYPLWRDPGNRVHQLQWRMLDLAVDLVHRAEAVADNDRSRHHARIARHQLDQALHSCQFWWASRRPMWEVNMVHRGLQEQEQAILNATLAVRSCAANQEAQAEATYRFLAGRDLGARIVDQLLE